MIPNLALSMNPHPKNQHPIRKNPYPKKIPYPHPKKKIESINVETNLRDDIGLDSLDLAELTVIIEAEFDIDIFENGIINTVGEIFEKLKNF